jgi:hypothetical protein
MATPHRKECQQILAQNGRNLKGPHESNMEECTNNQHKATSWEQPTQYPLEEPNT